MKFLPLILHSAKFINMPQGHVKFTGIKILEGGKNCLVNEKMQVINFILSAGNINDNQLALPIFHGINIKDKKNSGG